MMSGVTPSPSAANICPVRPNPVWISSKMSNAPNSSAMRRTSRTNAAGKTMPPPLPWIGSIMIAATGPSTPRWRVSRIGAAHPASQCPSGPCWARRQQRYA